MSSPTLRLFPCPVCLTILEDCQCPSCRERRAKNDIAICENCLTAIRSHPDGSYQAIPTESEAATLTAGQKEWLAASRIALIKALLAEGTVLQ